LISCTFLGLTLTTCDQAIDAINEYYAYTGQLGAPATNSKDLTE